MSGKYERKAGAPDHEVLAVTSLGHGLTLRRTTSVGFNHKKATEFLELKEFVGDRPLKQGHVDYLIGAMQRGTFRPELVTLITCECSGVTYRMNGQHTAWARLDVDADFECPVKLLEYVAVSEEDMRGLYASIDRSSPRTKANVIQSYLAGTTEFDGLKRHVVMGLPYGLSVWLWPTSAERRRHDGDDMAFLIKTTHYDLAMKVAGFLNTCAYNDSKHIFRAPAVAAMFATFSKAPNIAKDFWRPVADGVGIDKKGDPRLRLRNWLMQTALGLGEGAKSDKKQVNQEYMYRACVAAWNAFREGRDLQVIKPVVTGKRPVLR